MTVKSGRLFACLFCLLAVPICVFAQEEFPVIGDISIEIIDAPGGRESFWEKIAADLIFMEEGDRFSERWFADSLQVLRDSSLFKSIDVPDPDWSNPPITLIFRLTPFARIENIRISGGFPILQSEIRNAMTITTGDPYAEETMAEQEDLIKEVFVDAGFIDPAVSIHPEENPETGDYTLDIDIDTGKFFRIETVEIEGNESFSDLRLKIRLSTWQSSFLYGGPSRLVEKTVDKDRETLLDFYRGAGYADADVEFLIERNRNTGTAAVIFKIDEGPRYDIELYGYDAFWGWTLKKDIAVFERGNRSGLGLRRTVRNLENRYREAGFRDVQVDLEDETIREDDRDVRKIRIVIEEGPRYVVGDVVIEGNENFPDERITDQMLTGPPGLLASGAYAPETLDEDIQAIRTFYLQNGFLNATVETDADVGENGPEQEIVEVDVMLRIREGPQTVISNVSVEGVENLDPETVRRMVALSPGTPYRPNIVRENRIDLAAKISERGYPHVTVDPGVEISRNQTEADIVYQVDEGPYVEMGNTYYIGNFKTTPGILDRQVTLDPGEPFSLEKILETQRNIRGINALESAQFQTVGLKQKAPRVNLLSEVQEKRPYFAEFTVGYDTWRNLYVDTTVGTINFLGLNKEISAGLQWSQIGYLARLGITEPSLLGSRITANGIIFAEEREELNQDFGVRTYGAAIGFSRAFLKNFTGTLNVGYESRDLYRLDDDPIPPEDADLYEPRSVVVTTPGVIYNNTDSFVRPTRGTMTSFKVDVSHGLSNSLDDYFKYRLDSRYYYSPLDRVTLAFRGFYGYIDPYGSMDMVPEDQLFFLGGTTDVRGFSQNELRTDEDGDPVGGKTAFIGSMEIRLDIGMNLEFVTFYDGGAVRKPLRDAGTDDWRSTAGVGLRYITAIGPIGIMYGRKIDRREGESPGAIHFAIGYTF